MDNRRISDRRISPAIGQYAIEEAHRLREVNKELLAALNDVSKAYSDNVEIFPVFFQTYMDIVENALAHATGGNHV